MNFQRNMVPVPDQPLLLKWNNPIQRSLVRGRGVSYKFGQRTCLIHIHINIK